jgi:hypothetical protein
VGVSEGGSPNDLFAKGGPALPPVDLFAAAQATPNAEEAHSAVQQGAAAEIGWFKDESGSREGASSASGLFSMDSLDMVGEGGREKGDVEGGGREETKVGGEGKDGLGRGGNLHKNGEDVSSKSLSVGLDRETLQSAADKQTEGPVGTSTVQSRKGETKAQRGSESLEAKPAQLSGEASEVVESSGQSPLEKGVASEAVRLTGNLGVAAASAGGVAVASGGLGKSPVKQAPDKETGGVIAGGLNNRSEALDSQRQSLGAPDSSISARPHDKGEMTDHLVEEGGPSSTSSKVNRSEGQENPEFNDINFWKSNYGVLVEEDAL